MQVSEKKGETGILGACLYAIFLVLKKCETKILRTACEVGLSLIFFGPEPAHALFGTEHRHKIAEKFFEVE